MTSNDSLMNISPLDGRYQSKTSELSPYLSEFGLMKYRVKVEIEYLIMLHLGGIIHTVSIDDPKIIYEEKKCTYDIVNKNDSLVSSDDDQEKHKKKKYNYNLLRNIYHDFDIDDAKKIKEYEKTTNHDVKAVEYWIKEILINPLQPDWIRQLTPWVHFALTSQDINTSAFVMQLRYSFNNVIIPEFKNLGSLLNDLCQNNRNVVMLARTHGQPASPTTLGKELCVFYYRLLNGINHTTKIPWKTKFGGATGNFNAHFLTFPQINWKKFADDLCDFGFYLERSQVTTQIDSYDNLSNHLNAWKQNATILIDFCRDIWSYISMEYFVLKIVDHEVGSSAMPHKVNPIDFENAEGNLLLAVNLFEFFSRKLPVSRLQRDLTDSTVLRNIGVAVGHLLVAIKSINKGLNKLQVNHEAIKADLEKNWIVIVEGIQNILKKEGIEDGYEIIKSMTRKHNVDQIQFKNDLIELLKEKNISIEACEKILNLTPQIYTGDSFLP